MTTQTDTTLTTAELFHAVDQKRTTLWDTAPISAPITARQYLILRCISEIQPCSQTQIVEVAGIDRSTVAEVIQRLVKSGHVTRRRNRNDSRAYDISLTAKGRAELTEARRTDATVNGALLNVLTNTEEKKLRRVLVRILGVGQ